MRTHACRAITKAALAAACLSMAAPVAAQAPCNPNAITAARALLSYFYSIRGRTTGRVVSGQFVGHINPDMTDIQGLRDRYGTWIGMIGGDYYYMGASTATYTNMNAAFIDYWNKGGLVTLSLHMSNVFIDGEGVRLTDKANPPEVINIPAMLTEGTAPNARFKSELNRIADGLLQLQTAGVVVLLRPFHEFTGNWFWWGWQVLTRDGQRTGTDAGAVYKSLWTYTFNYLTKTRHVNNALWVFPMCSDKPYGIPSYPGPSYCDLTSDESYNDNPDQDTRVVGTLDNKPMGVFEIGPVTKDGSFDCAKVLNALKGKWRNAVYFQFWGGIYGMYRNVNGDLLLRDPIVVNRPVAFMATGTTPSTGRAVPATGMHIATRVLEMAGARPSPWTDGPQYSALGRLVVGGAADGRRSGDLATGMVARPTRAR